MEYGAYEDNLTEGIKSDIKKMWVVRKPTCKCEPEELLSHESFDNMYDTYSEGTTSDDVYGIYFDKTKATNIARRLVNKYNKNIIEPSEEVIAEARLRISEAKKKKKKKAKTTTAKRKKVKKRTTRRVVRRPNSFNALAAAYYTPVMTKDPGYGGDGGGDGGGGGGE